LANAGGGGPVTLVSLGRFPRRSLRQSAPADAALYYRLLDETLRDHIVFVGSMIVETLGKV